MARKGRTSPVAEAARVPRPPLEPVVTPPSEAFKDAVFNELRDMERARRDANRLPEHILYRELERHLAAALNALYSDGRLAVGQTVNDKYLRTKESTSDAEQQEATGQMGGAAQA